MPTISFPFDAALRIVAIHEAASDKEKSSSIQSGVCLRTVAPAQDCQHGNHSMVITATDDKLLMEERWTLDAQDPDALGEREINLGAAEVGRLALWLKAVKASLGKRTSCTVELQHNGNSVTIRSLGLPVGDCPMTATEGCFPRYEHALRPCGGPTPISRIGFNLAYFAALAKAWNSKKLKIVPAACKFHRGVVVRRMILPVGCTSAMAIVMPISLPS